MYVTPNTFRRDHRYHAVDRRAADFADDARVQRTLGYDGFTGGKESYNLAAINASTFAGTFVRDDLRSRFQAQWGVRLRF